VRCTVGIVSREVTSKKGIPRKCEDMIAQGSDMGANFGGVGREAVFPNILAKFGGKKRELVKCVGSTAAGVAIFVSVSFDCSLGECVCHDK
jgi:hypothetical protein